MTIDLHNFDVFQMFTVFMLMISIISWGIEGSGTQRRNAR
jgi:hypothetical protein